MAVFQMFDFGRGSALDPAGELIALPAHSWIGGAEIARPDIARPENAAPD